MAKRRVWRVIRVLVGSRSSLVRAGLESVVRSIPSLEFAGTIDPHHVSRSELSGDVLLIEAGNPSDAIDSANEEWQSLADLPIPVVLLLDCSDPDLVGAALRAGVRGAISWDATPEEIEGAVHAVSAGLVVTTRTAVAEVLPDAQPAAEELAEPLSARELEVLDLLAEGLSNKLIAHGLNISEHTVKTHVASIFAKLGASSRTEAVSQAIRRGLVML
jgi:DNA-binding NarL/FixJ family response regulator